MDFLRVINIYVFIYLPAESFFYFLLYNDILKSFEEN